MIHLYKYIKLGIFVPFFLLSAFSLTYGQETQDPPAKQETLIKGKLTDEQTGEALIGAFVFIKGTKTGAQTDIDGNFEIKTDQAPPFTLAVNYIGYQNKEIEVYETEDAVEFKLRVIQALDEVVVIGYGEQKRSDLTGSVSSVPKELKAQPVASVERLLQGSIAGATVTQTSGQPGGGVSVQIRGNNSITAGSDPLYVIDGFPINNDNSITDAGVTDRDGVRLNPLTTINPGDIESIDVLKDASATAIYGSRGANGVIIITTKKGSANKSSISYDGYYGVQRIVKKIDLLNGAEWWQLRKEAARNTPNSQSPALRPGNFDYDTTGAGTDWQEEAFREAPIKSHSLTILTGSEKTRLAVSGNYFDQQGVLLNTGFKRYTGRINAEHDYNNRLKIASSVVASRTEADIAPQATVPNLLFTSPAIPVYDRNGSFVKNTSTDSPLQNPINSLVNQVNESQTSRLLGNIYGEYKIIKGLSVKVLLGTDIVLNKQNRYLPNSTYEGNPSGGAGTGGIATVGSVYTNSWLNENTLNYQKVINKKHNISAVAGFTAQSSKSDGFIASSSTFTNDDLSYNALQNGSGSRAPTSSSVSWKLASYLGRINYILSDKYLLTLTLRADGSSRFGDDKKWGYFPSAAVGWNVHKEDFFAPVKKVSELKLRLSAGQTGNQGIPPYSSISQLSAFRYNFSNTNVQGYAPISVNNAGLGWEKTFQVDFGTDLGFFKNRILFAFDYYYKKTTDLLLNAPVPGTSGLSYYDPVLNTSQASTVYQNIGEVENKGYEISVNSQNVLRKNFTWNTLFIFSKNSNKILSLGKGVDRIQPNINEPSVLQVGAPVGSFLVYKTNGVIKPGDQEGAKALTPQGDKGVGGQKYQDVDGDGTITQSGDRVVIKNQPGVNLGLTNSFSYKSSFGTIDFTIFFQSTIGGKIYNQNRATLELGTGYFNGNRNTLDRYSENNPDSDVKEAYQDPAVTISDRFIEDASYLRLKNLTLGYSLPENLLSFAKIKGIRIYVSAQNLVTWTKYTGYDPEASVANASLINRGLDRGVYPNAKTILGGLSLTF